VKLKSFIAKFNLQSFVLLHSSPGEINIFDFDSTRNICSNFNRIVYVS
jgi:hypothetical protein